MISYTAELAAAYREDPSYHPDAPTVCAWCGERGTADDPLVDELHHECRREEQAIRPATAALRQPWPA